MQMLRCNVKPLKNNWAVVRAVAATFVSLEGLQDERSRKVLICQARTHRRIRCHLGATPNQGVLPTESFNYC